MKRDTPAESVWRHYCSTPLHDFFRGLRLIIAGDFRNANTNLYCADMTPVAFSLEMLDEEQIRKLEPDEEWHMELVDARLQLEPHALAESEPMDDLASFLGGEAPVDDLVAVPPVDPKPHPSYLDHL